ncbi:hypothetical protein HanPI659440_Chr12g0473471 [Helianthus annuus]|nr:hypothetical protein HanPI659440_Chr12g0473471 [Helianthus annuus]
MLILGSFINRTEPIGSFTTELKIERAFSEQFPNEHRTSFEHRAIWTALHSGGDARQRRHRHGDGGSSLVQLWRREPAAAATGKQQQVMTSDKLVVHFEWWRQLKLGYGSGDRAIWFGPETVVWWTRVVERKLMVVEPFGSNTRTPFRFSAYLGQYHVMFEYLCLL